MPKCARCGVEYDAEYDGCPACANAPSAPSAKSRFPLPLLLVLVGAIVASIAFSGSGGSGQVYSMSQFNRVQNGMTLDQVVDIMGDGGTKSVDQEVAGYTGQIYTWQNPDGSNMIVQFQNGEVVTKAQAGLE